MSDVQETIQKIEGCVHWLSENTDFCLHCRPIEHANTETSILNIEAEICGEKVSTVQQVNICDDLKTLLYLSKDALATNRPTMPAAAETTPPWPQQQWPTTN